MFNRHGSSRSVEFQFVGFGVVSKIQHTKDSKALCEFHEAMGKAMFVSHQWISKHHPDPKFQQLVVLQNALKNLLAGRSKVSLPPAIEIIANGTAKKCPTPADFQSSLFVWYDSWYLWVFDDTVAPPGMYKNPVDNGINHHINWSRISSINRTCWKCPFNLCRRAPFHFLEVKASLVLYSARPCHEVPRTIFVVPKGIQLLLATNVSLQLVPFPHMSQLGTVLKRPETPNVANKKLSRVWTSGCQFNQGFSKRIFFQSQLRHAVFSSSFCVLLWSMQMDRPWATRAGKGVAGAAWKGCLESCLGKVGAMIPRVEWCYCLHLFTIALSWGVYGCLWGGSI